MDNFAAIDFETANGHRTSICSVGVVIYRGGVEVDSFYSLIKPEPDYYNYWCMRVHGISDKDTCAAPLFDEVWRSLEPLIGDLPLVAHNKAFDESCLKAAMKCYGMDYPDYEFYCTLKAARRLLKDLPNYQLQTVAEACGCDLKKHHHALADARACAVIAHKIL